MKQLIKKHEQKVRFLIVGGWNTAFGYAAFAAIYFLLNNYLHYLVILVISYIIGITNAYFCYKFFVFKTKGNYLKEYLRFYLVYGIVFIINLALLPIAVEFFKINPLLSQGGIIFIAVFLSYFGHKNFSFKEQQIFGK